MDSSPPDGPLAFGDFLEHLRRQGFVIGVGEYLRLQQLLNRISGDCAPSDLKTLLCPILATNKLQQEQVYNALDTFFDLFQAASSKTESNTSVHDIPVARDKRRATDSRKWLYVTAGTLMLALMLALAQVLYVRSKAPTPVRISPTTEDFALPPPENRNQGKRENPRNSNADSPRPPNQRIESQEPPAIPRPQESFYRRYGNAIHLSTIFAPLIFFIIFEWRHLKRRRLILEKQHGKKPPFVWPLKMKASAFRLYDPLQLHNTARLMRRRQAGEFNRLDITATVAATIAAQGYPSFCYRADSKPPEYLVLIDRASFRDHETRLFDELTAALEREGLFIARYFYDGDPRACRNETGASFHLGELLEKYAEHRLLIFGDGEKIIDPITGGLEPWAAAFADWKQRALLTPEAPSSWGWKEIVLAEQFILLPATLEGLRAGVDHFELSRATDLRVWRQDSADAPPADLEEPGIVNRLRIYLGEEIFQWLCSCAVYPEIHWDLTLYLGSLGCMPQGMVEEESVLKLIRLPWFRSGSMPDNLRWLLIHELDREKEKDIRAAIIELMERNPPPRETFAADAFQLNLVVQRWLSLRERKLRREMLRALKTSPQSEPVRDYTVLRSLESARLSPLDFILPRRLRRLFYRRSIPAFGLRTGARFFGALTVSVIAAVLYFALYFPGTLSTAHGSFFSSEDLLRRNVAVRPSNSSCLRCHSATERMQDKCISCHIALGVQTDLSVETVTVFRPMVSEAHDREGIECMTCHTEHEGRDIRAGLVRYRLCSNCHNGSYKIKTGERAGAVLSIPHGGTVGYPVVDGKWAWTGLSAERLKKSGQSETLASRTPSDQFHAIHELGRMENIMSCTGCHTAGKLGGTEFRASPRVECAKCHGILITDAGEPQDVKANCNTCHPEHGQSEDLEKLVVYSANLRKRMLVNKQLDEGNRLYLIGRYAEALLWYQKAIQLDPRRASAYVGLGNTSRAMAKDAEAESWYQKAIELDPAFAEAYIGLGNIFGGRKMYDQAEAEFRKALMLDPNHAMAHSNLGANLMSQKRYPEAEAELKKALSIDPTLPVAQENLTRLLKENGSKTR